MVTHGTPERMLSDDERALLELATREGPKAYPIQQLAGKWTWDYQSLQAPRMYETRKEAVEQLEGFVAVLRESARVQAERSYTVERVDG